VADELITNRIEAYVVSRDPLSDEELVKFMRARIPRYMIPERFRFVDGLPKTTTGKIDRASLATAQNERGNDPL
jgi:acyl-coenzyme A synthetase/AMP-(fatty) acid ligase